MKLQIHPGTLLLAPVMFVTCHLDITVMLLCLASMVLHETVHVVVARYYGVKVYAVGCKFIGTFSIRESSELHDVVISASAPITNMAVAVAMIPFSDFGFYGDRIVFTTNLLLLGVLNFLPFAPMDGVKIWRKPHGHKAAAL